MSAHECLAVGCKVHVSARVLMCRAHWRKVPREEQQAVYAAFNPSQLHTHRPSGAWVRASRAAILRVALAEGCFTYAQVELFRAASAQLAGALEAWGGAA